MVKQYNNLRKQIEKEFNVSLKRTPIIYDPIQSDIDTSSQIDGNKLNRSNLSTYWNLLEKNTSVNKMYFSVGEITNDKALSKYEKYLLFEYNGKTYEWAPSRTGIENSDSWDVEFSSMTKQVSECFGIDKNNMTFSNIELTDGRDLYGEWDDLFSSKAESSRKVLVEVTEKNFEKNDENKENPDHGSKIMVWHDSGTGASSGVMSGNGNRYGNVDSVFDADGDTKEGLDSDVTLDLLEQFEVCLFCSVLTVVFMSGRLP